MRIKQKFEKGNLFNFFIGSVHVESVGETQLRGRAGRHCGQKRTYRAVSTRIYTTIVSNSGSLLQII